MALLAAGLLIRAVLTAPRNAGVRAPELRPRTRGWRALRDGQRRRHLQHGPRRRPVARVQGGLGGHGVGGEPARRHGGARDRPRRLPPVARPPADEGRALGRHARQHGRRQRAAAAQPDAPRGGRRLGPARRGAGRQGAAGAGGSRVLDRPQRRQLARVPARPRALPREARVDREPALLPRRSSHRVPRGRGGARPRRTRVRLRPRHRPGDAAHAGVDERARPRLVSGRTRGLVRGRRPPRQPRAAGGGPAGPRARAARGARLADAVGRLARRAGPVRARGGAQGGLRRGGRRRDAARPVLAGPVRRRRPVVGRAEDPVRRPRRRLPADAARAADAARPLGRVRRRDRAVGRPRARDQPGPHAPDDRVRRRQPHAGAAGARHHDLRRRACGSPTGSASSSTAGRTAAPCAPSSRTSRAGRRAR